MNNDEKAKSIWQDGAEDINPLNIWDKDKIYDVLIVGGGVAGLTTAVVLQEKGINCIVAEAHHIGSGTTSRSTGHLNTLLETPYYQVATKFGATAAMQLATGSREAIDLVEGLVSKYQIDCDFTYKAAFLFAENDKETNALQMIKDANNKVSVLTEWSNSIPVPLPFEKALKIEFQAQIHPIKYLMGLANAFEKNGGVMLQDCAVNDLIEGDIVTANTSLGVIKASVALYATPGTNTFGTQCASHPAYAMAFTLKSGQYPDGLVYDSKTCHNFRTHNIDGQNYIIAGSGDKSKDTADVFAAFEAYLRKYFDIDTIACKWSSSHCISADGLPYIGLMPGQKSTYMATGFGGDILTFGSLAAKTICALVSKEETPYEHLFDPGRINNRK